MFKFKVDQLVYSMVDNKVHSAPVLSRSYVENKFTDDQRCTKEQEHSFGRLGKDGIQYATIHAIYTEDQLFESKEALLDSFK